MSKASSVLWLVSHNSLGKELHHLGRSIAYMQRRPESHTRSDGTTARHQSKYCIDDRPTSHLETSEWRYLRNWSYDPLQVLF